MRARKLSPVGGIDNPVAAPIAVRVAEACQLTGICRSKLYEILYDDLRLLIEQASRVGDRAFPEFQRPEATPHIDENNPKIRPVVTRRKRCARAHVPMTSALARQGNLFELLLAANPPAEERGR
jgi:predicted DNA-binding transcriptional regulator AlpA